MNKSVLLFLFTIFNLFNIQAQDVYWPENTSEINTGVNATYMIQSANIDGTPILFGYKLGAFFINDEGNLQCGGVTDWTGSTGQLAVLGDDTTTEDKDGFYEGETITWLAYNTFADQTYSATVEFAMGSGNYSVNALNIISNFTISSAVNGCTDSLACNYNANATTDDGSCYYAEENFNCDGSCIDTDGDSVCDIDEVLGCTDTEACNYNAEATEEEDDSCIQAETNLNCDGSCINDEDLDGICDENEILGCTDNTACNFDANATENDDSCTYTSGCESCEENIIISNDDDNDGICNADEIEGCQDENACNYNISATDSNDSCIYATGECDSCSGETNGTGTVVNNDADDDGVCNEDEQGACIDESACNYNSDSTVEEDNTLCIYASGCDECSGETDGTGTIIDLDIDNDGVCDADEVSGCQDEDACNFNSNATDDNNSCEYATGCETCSGETDGTGTIISNDDDQDGVCNANEIEGCQDSNACNYNENATDAGLCMYAEDMSDCAVCSGETDGTGSIVNNDDDQDGICNENEIIGCQNSDACNYNENATDEGECIYAEDVDACASCSGETDGTGTIINNDEDNDGICDADEILGCMDPLYLEYNPLATDQDESCLTLIVMGCTDELAFNYNDEANSDDESCINSVTVSFTENGTNSTTNYSVVSEDIYLILGDLPITNGDLIGGFYLENNQLFCAGFSEWTGNDFSLNLWVDDPTTPEIDGLTENHTIYWIAHQNSSSFNYLLEFTTLEAPGATFVTNMTVNETTTIGCMDATAFNYNDNAFIDDGSCEPYIEGCTDENACNYDEDANTDNGSCYYITVSLSEYTAGNPITAETDAENPTFAWYINDNVQAETSSSLTPYINGEYIVIVTDQFGCSASDTMQINNVGIEEENIELLNIYPNPANDFITINSNSSKIETLKLFSIEGRLLFQVEVNAEQYRVSRNNLSAGIYFIEAKLGSHTITKQVQFK